MKKLFAMILAGAMVLSLAACGQKTEISNTSVNENMQIETIAGGWSSADSPVITDEVKALFEKATEGMTGANYIPVAYLGSQVVAGTNHKVLCRVSPVVPDAAETYAIVTLYEDIDGNVEISDVKDFDKETDLSGETLPGGWAQADSPVVTDVAKAVFEKATEELTGVSYKPVALLSTQTVAGTNYCFLCEATVIIPDAEPSYALVYVSEDLDGNAKLSEIADLAVEIENGTERTVIISMDPDMTEEAIQALLKKYNLSLVYKYSNFNMIAAQLPTAISEEEMAKLLNQLSAEDGVLGAERDSVLNLDDGETNVQIPNPFSDYGSLADATKAVGFDMTAPDAVDGYGEKLIQVMNNEMIQVIFLNGDSRLFLRKAAGNEDISGDYNTYAETQTVTIGDNSVTMKGNNGTISLAIWTNNGYTYAVTSDEAMSVEAMTALVSQIS